MRLEVGKHPPQLKDGLRRREAELEAQISEPLSIWQTVRRTEREQASGKESRIHQL